MRRICFPAFCFAWSSNRLWELLTFGLSPLSRDGKNKTSWQLSNFTYAHTNPLTTPTTPTTARVLLSWSSSGLEESRRLETSTCRHGASGARRAPAALKGHKPQRRADRKHYEYWKPLLDGSFHTQFHLNSARGPPRDLYYVHNRLACAYRFRHTRLLVHSRT